MPRDRVLLCLVVSAVAAIVHLFLAGYSATHLETVWDESVDRRIALGLRDHPLVGEQPTLDPSQTRLPMYATALLYRVTGRDSVGMGRAGSIVCGAITVFATGMLGGSLFGGAVGAMAAALLAFSPYFIGFSRIAMTEGDVYFACTMTLALWSFIGYLRRPNITRAVGTAILLAATVGAKFYGGILVVVFLVLTRWTRLHRPLERDPSRRDLWRYRNLLAMGWVVIGVTVIVAIWSKPGAVVGWVVLLAVWLYAVGLALIKRTLDPRPWPALFGLLALAGLSFFALIPVHLIEHRILRELLHRTLSWDHHVPLALAGDHLRLYSGIILIKLTWPLGILTALGLIYAAVTERDHARWRPIVLTTIWYVVALCFLPLRQTFYLMGVYPLLMILTAGMIEQVGVWARSYSRGLRSAWAVTAAGMFVHLVVQVRASYPDYHLYGHAWIGDRWLGAGAIGYRNLIQTPSDGVESLGHWCRQHIGAGRRVVSYVWEDAILDPLLAGAPFEFTPRGLSESSDALPPPPPIDTADYVLLHLNNRIGYGDRPPDWPDEKVLDALFTPVFTVSRAGLEVAWVYGRKVSNPPAR